MLVLLFFAFVSSSFFASKVFLVLRPPTSGAGQIKVFLDEKLIDNLNAGADVENGVVKVDMDRLYNLINLSNPQDHLLRFEFTPGIEAFAFTFG